MGALAIDDFAGVGWGVGRARGWAEVVADVAG